MFGKKKRCAISILLGIFFSIQLLFFARPVHAFPVEVTADLPGIADKVQLTIEKALFASALSALVQGASYFMRKLAYDSANYIAYGGKGQGALAFKDGFGSYLEDSALDSAATAIDEFGKPFGLNLCGIPDVNLRIQLQIGFRSIYGYGETGGPQPTCRWQEVKNSLFSADAWEAKYGPGNREYMAEFFNQSLQVSETDFGIALSAMEKIDRVQAQQREANLLDRLEGDGFKSITNLIAGNIKTPAYLVKEESTALTAKHQGEISAEQIAGIYGSSALEILPMAGSVFLNTLVSSLLNQVLKKGLLPDGSGSTPGTSSEALDFFAINVLNNKKAAEIAFNFLFTAVPNKQLHAYDVVSEFAACPNNPGINNCVIDTDLQRVIERAKQGEPLTIAEALKEGLLHADWPLISPLRVAEHTAVENCFLRKYCYSNIQKLRKVRILPLGFEIAALRSDPDQPWTLGEVVAGFEDCNPASPTSQFCHLIDPKWVIRSPEARCEAEVFGAGLASSDGPIRRKECVDISTCIVEGPNGECLGNYGYCTKEKNIWRLPGNSCPAEFNTCKTFVHKDSGSVVSYISRTLDYGECSPDSVGCLPYSAEQKDGTWLTSQEIDMTKKAAGRNQVYFFNEKVEQFSDHCSVNGEGCTAFYTAAKQSNGTYTKSSSLVHLKKAPDYLGCYDTNATQEGIQWPVDKAEAINNLPETAACNQFAAACAPEEAGCLQYDPGSGDPSIPGIIGSNICEQACVGYDTFKQEATVFAPSEYPLYFIPTAGKTCSLQHVGCDEFTNIEEKAEGGEGLEYYSSLKYCEKPTGNNSKTFYSWEGSVSQGYLLKVHSLKQIDSDEGLYLHGLSLNLGGQTPNEFFAIGSPAYADDSQEALNYYYSLCHQENYNALVNNFGGSNSASQDCRALYDSSGNIYYRLLEKTVTVSPACHLLRKTIPFFEVDEGIANKEICENKKGGIFQNGVCQRCSNGGVYIDGSCTYQTISGPGESASCPKSANGCRAFTGNTGNNIQTVFADSFEPSEVNAQGLLAAKAGWNVVGAGSAKVAAEAIQVGLHSLQVDADSIVRDLVTTTPDAIQSNEWYELSFWARGAAQTLTITFEQNGEKGSFILDPTTSSMLPVQITADWHYYKLGPVKFTGSSLQNATLEFKRTLVPGGNAAFTAYFIDNIELTRLTNKLYAIKNSWKTPSGLDVPFICDADPSDAFPGKALGCKAYTETFSQKKVFATGFDTLCRDKAVGCQAMYDSYNTVGTGDAEKLQAYMVECLEGTYPANVSGLPPKTEGVCVVSLGEKEYSCTPKPGFNSCTISDAVVIPDGYKICGPQGIKGSIIPSGINCDSVSTPYKDFLRIVQSSIVIPADTPTSLPLFLTNRPDVRCNESERGCMKVGQEKLLIPNQSATTSFDFSETYLKNDPALYTGTNGILCPYAGVGCDVFSANNTLTYFKNPSLTGNTFCEYKENITAFGVKKTGWFKVGIGTCNTNNALCSTETQKKDCGENGVCQNIGSVSCYDNYVLPGGKQGLWSSESDQYEGYVGICNEQYAGCTELLDPADSNANNTKGQAYYAIYDDLLTDPAGDCEGEASLNAGCVLFNRTELPNKLYSAKDTYKKSADKGGDKYGRVTPVSNANNDTNVLLKVTRDRTCGEWLECQASIPHTNEKGETVDICYDYRACNESNGQFCSNFIDPSETTHSTKFLSQEKYTKRDTSWYGMDYSGYSLFNKYQINDFAYFSLPDENNDLSFVAYKIHNLDEQVQDNQNLIGCTEVSTGGAKIKENWSVCGFDSTGRCLGGECVYPIDGVYLDKQKPQNDLTQSICKAYPEASSPFPDSYGIVEPEYEDFVSKKDGFEGANVCRNGQGDCSCSYGKITYTNGQTTYWSSAAEGSKDENRMGVCVGGKREGKVCFTDDFCGEGDTKDNPGTCKRDSITKKSTHFGLTGYCLEEDLSRPIDPKTGEFTCLTWLPLDVNVSGLDNYNVFPGAGFDDSQDRSQSWDGMYCVNSTNISGSTLLDPSPYTSAFNTGTNGGPLCAVNLGIDAGFVECTESSVKNCSAPKFGVDGLYNMIGCSAKATTFAGAIQGWANATNWPTVALDAKGKPVGQEKKSSLVVLRAESVKHSPESTHPAAALQGFNIPFQLLPDDEDIFGEGDVANDWTGAAVLRHPPRIWNKQEEAVDINYQTSMGGYTFYTEPDKTVSGIVASPGPYLQGYAGMNDDVYRSEFEAYLRKDDLRRAYFVPVGYPRGLQGNHPDLLSKDLYIDFDVLDSLFAANPANAVTAHTTLVNKGGKYHFASGQGTDSNMVLTYRIDNPKPYYQDPSIVKSSVGKDTPENAVKSRYMLVFYDHKNDTYPKGGDGIASNWLPTFVNNTFILGDTQSTSPGKPIIPTIDPFGIDVLQVTDMEGFLTLCRNHSGPHDNGKMWFAVAMDFNKDGHFLGYMSRYCLGLSTDDDDSSDQAKSGMALAVVGELKNSCTELAQVIDPTVDDAVVPGNKAWTNRTWKDSVQYKPLLFVNNNDKDYYQNFIHALLQSPFGGTTLTANTKITSSTYHSFSIPGDGIPYACTSVLSPGAKISSGVPGNCLGLPSAFTTLSNGLSFRTAAQGQNQLYQIFAKTFGTAERVAGQNDLFYDIVSVDLNNDKKKDEVDKSGQTTFAPNLIPPQIYSLNPARCFGQAGTTCSVGEKDNITVNGKNGTLANYNKDPLGDADEAYQGLAEPDVHIESKSFHAVVQFFAFADDNRMPIRRWLVDWSDPSTEYVTNAGLKGKYKNHKPYCYVDDTTMGDIGLCGTTDSVAPTLVTCKEDADCPFAKDAPFSQNLTCIKSFKDDTIMVKPVQFQNPTLIPDIDAYSKPRFGNAARACTMEPFIAEYTYTCTPSKAELYGVDINSSLITNRQRQRLAEMGYTQGKVCVFKPRVQVMDNWGWCNGSCVKAYDNAGKPVGTPSEGCYNLVPNAVFSPVNQCNTQDKDAVTLGVNRWTSYKGSIIVIPN